MYIIIITDINVFLHLMTFAVCVCVCGPGFPYVGE